MSDHLIIGIGTGRCGTMALADMLNHQPMTVCWHEAANPLPWSAPNVREIIENRVIRLRSVARNAGSHTHVGDVASYYLNYVESLIAQEPDCSVIVLKRPVDETVDSFDAWLDYAPPPGRDHWMMCRDNVTADPKWDGSFPKFSVSTRREGIRRYWQEYYAKTEQLQNHYPENVRVWTLDQMQDVAQVERLLTFAGIQKEDRWPYMRRMNINPAREKL
jgi:hypothetical protein